MKLFCAGASTWGVHRSCQDLRGFWPRGDASSLLSALRGYLLTADVWHLALLLAQLVSPLTLALQLLLFLYSKPRVNQ